MAGFLLTALVMFCFWILLSGQFDFLLLSLGAASSLLVAYWSHDLLFIGKVDIRSGAGVIVRFIKYLPWLLWQITLANIYLVYLTLHPRMLINPEIVKFNTGLKTDLGIVTLANSITLTPGTVTIIANHDEFIVHAITRGAAQSLVDGEMQARVKEVEGKNV